MSKTFQFAWEIALMEFIQSNMMNSQLMITLMTVFTYIGETATAVIIIGFAYLAFDKNLGKLLAVNVLSANTFTFFVKNIFIRRRPYFDNPNIKCLKVVDSNFDMYDIAGQGYSFPSGHSVCASATGWTFFSYFKKKKFFFIAVIMSLLVMLSRVALGVHYPSDVIVGFFIGVLFVVISYFSNQHVSKTKYYLCLIILAGFGFVICDSYDFYSAYGTLIGFLLGDLYEEKYVQFKNTRNLLKAIIRLALAGGIFLGISEGMKLIPAYSYFTEGTFGYLLLRTVRYALATFIAVGVYPKVFKYNLLKLDDKLKDGK